MTDFQKLETKCLFFFLSVGIEDIFRGFTITHTPYTTNWTLNVSTLKWGPKLRIGQNRKSMLYFSQQ